MRAVPGDPTRARFPDLGDRAGGYESFYVKATHPDEPIGVWIRYTVHKHPGEPARGSLWFTFFDTRADGPLASKVTPPAADLGATDGEFLHIGDSVFGPHRLSGAARSQQLDAEWDLTYEGAEEPLWHLPRGWMYRAPLPKTKLLSPFPAARFSGAVKVGDRRVELESWPGMVGHNWGALHAERWIWMHGAGFDGRGQDTWLDAAIGRIKLGPATTPWIANGALSIDGERHQLGGIERVRATQIAESPEGCDFTLPGKGITVRGRVGAEREDFVGWVYADPDGSEHNTVNCSVSDMTLTVERDGQPRLTLQAIDGAAYELGMREKDHGMPLQPFPDG